MRHYSNEELAKIYRYFAIRYCELAIINHILQITSKVEDYFLSLEDIYDRAGTLRDPAEQLRFCDYDLLLFELSFERGLNETITRVIQWRNTMWGSRRFPNHRFDDNLLADSLVVVKHEPKVPIIQPGLILG